MGFAGRLRLVTRAHLRVLGRRHDVLEGLLELLGLVLELLLVLLRDVLEVFQGPARNSAFKSILRRTKIWSPMSQFSRGPAYDYEPDQSLLHRPDLTSGL